MVYKCSECGKRLEGNGVGLKTFTCAAHPVRFVTVIRDLSGGKEHDKTNRQVPVTLKRHTLVVAYVA